jgi:DNA-binding beta-propeller fold protein YncE
MKKPWITDDRKNAAMLLLLLAILFFSILRGETKAEESVTQDAIKNIPTQGAPFAAIPSENGQWLFVTVSASNRRDKVSGSGDGIVVLRKGDGGFSFERFMPTGGTPVGMVLTHDGKLAIVAAATHIDFMDIARLTAGEKNAMIGSLVMGDGSGSFFVNVTRDDHFLFVAEESARKIAVIDLVKARKSGFTSDAIVGAIPVGNAPIALIFSPDERYLYTTSESMDEEAGWPADCAPEGSQGDPNRKRGPQGAVILIDVERAKTSPSNAVVAKAPAGCDAVRLVLAPKADVAFVTARGDNEVLALDTGKLLTDPMHAKLARLKIGQSPVGVIVDQSGDRLYVTSSNRFANDANDRQFVAVIDASGAKDGKLLPLGRIPAGAFPRELHFTNDQETLIITNFLSKTVELVDLRKVKLDAF